MTLLAIELNDAGLVLARAAADGPALLDESEGYALLEGETVLTGGAARRRARLRPIFAYNRFWRELGVAALPRTNTAAQTPADLAYIHLSSLLAPHRDGASGLLLALPAGYAREQLGLLLGIAEESGVQVAGLVDAAVAAVATVPSGARVLHLDLELHQAVLTLLDRGAELRRTQSELLPRHGMLALHEKWIEAIAGAFVKRTRFDPLHEARNEQVLWNSLPDWLGTLESAESTDIELADGQNTRSVELTRDLLLTATRDRLDALVKFVQGQCPAGVQTDLLLSHRAARAHGLAAALATIPGVTVRSLDRGAAATGALLCAEQIRKPAGQVTLVTRLTLGSSTVPTDTGRGAHAVAAEVPAAERPTHVLHAGRAHAISSTVLSIGSAPAPGARAMPVPAGPGISREHCRIGSRDGHAWLEDRSTYGTFVNESPVRGEVALRVGDRVRLGSPGVMLDLIQVVDDGAPPQL